MLLQLADALRKRGHHIVAVGPRGREGWLSAEFRKRGYTHEQYELKSPFDLDGYRRLRQILIDHRIEIVHLHEYTMAVYAGFAAHRLGLPYVVTMHGDTWSVSALRRRMALRWIFKRAEAVAAVSGATHAHLTEALGLKPQAILSIRNGIHFTPGERAPVRRELGLADSDVLIVAVGNLVPRKGHIVLMRALASLQGAAAQVPWHLAIAGSGTEEAMLLAFAKEKGLQDRIHILGHRQDIPNLLAAADIYTMPSLWEGLPVALLEAMFARKPVIASGVSGIPEAIVDRRDGLLTPPGDVAAISAALSIMLPDPAVRERFAAAAFARATAEFGVDKMTDTYERCYGIRPATA